MVNWCFGLVPKRPNHQPKPLVEGNNSYPATRWAPSGDQAELLKSSCRSGSSLGSVLLNAYGGPACGSMDRWKLLGRWSFPFHSGVASFRLLECGKFALYLLQYVFQTTKWRCLLKTLVRWCGQFSFLSTIRFFNTRKWTYGSRQIKDCCLQVKPIFYSW